MPHHQSILLLSLIIISPIYLGKLFGKRISSQVIDNKYCILEGKIIMIIKSDDKVIYCYNYRKRTLFTRRDMNNNSGVDNHCSECAFVWFE
jgi:hypothetical protein